MKCLKCGKDSKYEFCRQCKEEKHRAGAIISQNKKKLKDLLNQNILDPQLFEKFILYTDNIIKYGKIYMDFVEKKHYKLFKFFTGSTIVASVLLSVRSLSSLIIIHI